MSDTMTIKELAKETGLSIRTIRRAIKSVGYDARQGVTSHFTPEQCIRLVGAATRSRHESNQSPVPQVGQMAQALMPNVTGQSSDVSILVRTIAEMLPTMQKMADACLAMAAQNRQAIPTPAAITHMTVSGYCSERRVSCDRDAASRWGRMARELSDLRGLEILSVPDARWGHVNAYEVKVLAEVIGQ